MIVDDIGDVNPYILNAETRHKLKVTHYTLDGTEHRKLQDAAFERDERLKKLCKTLGVEYTSPLKNIEEVTRIAELKLEYFKNKKAYDVIFDEALKTMTPLQLKEFLENYPKQ